MPWHAALHHSFHSPASLRKSIFEDVLLGSMPRSLPAPTPVKSAWQWDVAGCDSDGYADAAEVGVKGEGRRKTEEEVVVQFLLVDSVKCRERKVNRRGSFMMLQVVVSLSHDVA